MLGVKRHVRLLAALMLELWTWKKIPKYWDTHFPSSGKASIQTKQNKQNESSQKAVLTKCGYYLVIIPQSTKECPIYDFFSIKKLIDINENEIKSLKKINEKILGSE